MAKESWFTVPQNLLQVDRYTSKWLQVDYEHLQSGYRQTFVDFPGGRLLNTSMVTIGRHFENLQSGSMQAFVLSRKWQQVDLISYTCTSQMVTSKLLYTSKMVINRLFYISRQTYLSPKLRKVDMFTWYLRYICFKVVAILLAVECHFSLK